MTTPRLAGTSGITLSPWPCQAPPPEGTISLRDALERRGLSKKAFLKRVHAGDIPYVKQGLGFFFRPEDVDALTDKPGERWSPTAAEMTEFRRLWKDEGREAVMAHFEISNSSAYYWAKKLGVSRRSYNRTAA